MPSARLLGYRLAVGTTLLGIVYFLVIAGMIVGGGFVFPPSMPVQLFGGIGTFLFAPLLVALMACLHVVAPAEKKIYSLLGLAFTLLFAVAVSINRFTQLGVVRQSLAAGPAAGVEWFLAYGDRSVMFGLELLGWGWFFGLAMLCAAPLFNGNKIERWLRAMMLLYAALGLICTLAFLLASPLAVIGFAAWGLVLYIITALLALYFRRLRF